MKIKLLLTVPLLLALLISAATAALAIGGSNVNQNIGQSANQGISGSMINNSTLNQSIGQQASQNAQGMGLGSANQNIGQNAGQSIQGSTISGSSVSQSTTQGATQNIAGQGMNNSFTSGQSIAQGAGQSIQGSNISGSSVSQGISQGAAQNIAGQGMTGNLSSSQNIAQGANQSIQGITLINGSISQSINQNAFQNITWNNQNYFTTVQQMASMTAEQRAALATSAQNFLALAPSMRTFIMPLADLNALNTARSSDVAILNVGTNPIPITTGALQVINIPLSQLSSSLSAIPTGKAIAVVSNSDMESAIAATLLRMQGYNAWAVRTGIC